MKTLKNLIVAVGLVVVATSASADVATFESAPSGGLFAAPNGWLGASSDTLVIDSLSIKSAVYLYINKSSSNPYANNGTTFMTATAGVQISAADGGLLSISQFDIGDSWYTNGALQQVSLVGTKEDGSFVTGSVDASASFVTTFISGFTDLKSLTLTGYSQYIALDNIHYSVSTPVPEPETYAMLLAGLGLLGWQARRRRLKFAA